MKHQLVFVNSKHLKDDTPPALRQVLAAIEDSLDKEAAENCFVEKARAD